MDFRDTSYLKKTIEYDPKTKQYYVVEKIGNQYFIPYARFQYYDGGKRVEKDARSYTVHDWEAGIEWTPIKAVEITAAYSIMDRRYEDSAKPVNVQKGNMLRLQLQFNY